MVVFEHIIVRTQTASIEMLRYDISSVKMECAYLYVSFHAPVRAVEGGSDEVFERLGTAVLRHAIVVA